MALLNISASARAAGKDRNTIKRYLNDGRLSSTKDASGKVVIDTAELVRVFGELKIDSTSESPAESPADSPENTTVHQAVEALQEQLRAAKEREEWLRGQLEAEQAHSRELEQRMLPPGEGKKGFWARILGS